LVKLNPSVNKKNRIQKVDYFSRPAGDFFKTKPAELILEDGKKFTGEVPVWQEDSDAAEVIFNSGMTGHVESLTDPSYSDQILTFTYPLIGNYGVHEKGWESEKIHAKGVVVSSLINDWSHPLSSQSFLVWLKDQNVPVIQNVDTRALTRHLRTQGVENGYIVSDTTMRNFKIHKPLVSIDKPKLYKTEDATKTVVLIDCGAKENIVRSLQGRKLNVLRVPFDYNLSNEKFDGVMLSNGPGDPKDYKRQRARIWHMFRQPVDVDSRRG
jgi:carbamoyl-phosphate synthase small subunit